VWILIKVLFPNACAHPIIRKASGVQRWEKFEMRSRLTDENLQQNELKIASYNIKYQSGCSFVI
jgi:hypothetical protein